jgi:autotransporter-associated beta strand protein
LGWDIPTSAAPNSATTPTSVASITNDASILPSTITMGGGIINSITNSSSGWGSTSWGASGNQSLDYINGNGDWFYFTVTAKPGKIVTINGVGVLTFSGSISGPGNWALLSSTSSAFTSTNLPTPGFTTNADFASGRIAGSGYTNSAVTAFSGALAASNIVIPSGKTLYFRLVGYNGTNSTGTGRIIGTNALDFTLLGSVSDAPIQTFTWNGGSSGPWNYTDSNWLDGSSAASVFLADNNAKFNSGATVTITNTGVSVGFLTNAVPSGQTTTLGGGSLAASSIVNNGSGNLALQSTNAATTLANSGTGTVSLSAPGTYTTVNLTAGKIETLANASLSGAVNVSGGSILDAGTFSNTIGILTVNDSSINGTGILKGSGSSFALETNNQTVAVALQGTGGLTKTGSKTLTLSGSNSFSGDITLSGGTLVTSGADKLPDTATVTMSANTILQLGGNETIRALSVATSANNTAQVDLQSYQMTLNVTSSNAFVASMIGTGSFVKNGSSVLTLNELGTFSGGTTLNSGSLRLQASGNRATNPDDGTVTLVSSAFGTGTLTLAGGSIFSSSTSGSSSSRNIYNNVDIKGSFSLGDANSTNGTGNITVSTNVTGAFTTLSADSTVTTVAAVEWQQPIIGPSFNLTKSGANSLTLAGTNSLASIIVQQGDLLVRNSNTLTSVTVGSGARLGYGSTSVTDVGYFGSAALILSNGASLGQQGTSGSGTEAERLLPNNISLLGDVTFGLGTHGCYFTGNLDLNGATRIVTLSNSTAISGIISNGGLTVTDTAGSTRSLTLSANNTFAGPTVASNGGRLVVSGSIASSASVTAETGGGIGYGSTNAFGANTVVLKNGTTFGQFAGMGTNNAERTIANNLSLQGDVTFGFGTYANFFAGGIDLGGANNRGIYLSNSTTFNGVISNGGLVINDTIQGTANNGRRTITVAAASTYSGPTVVAGGVTNVAIVTTNTNVSPVLIETNVVPVTYGPILLVTGSLASTNVTVQTNAILAGTGSVANVTVKSGGELAPGNSSAAPIAASGAFVLEPGSTATMQIDNLANYDRVTSSTSSALGGTVNVNFTPSAGSFQLFSGTVSGSPTLVVPTLTNANLVWVTNSFATTGAVSISNTQSAATPYGNWLTNYPTLANTNGTADPDSDGFDNNTEFAFDGNPTVGTPAFVTASNSGGQITVSFVALRTNTSGYSVLSTTNLVTGPWSTNTSVTVTNAADQTGVLLPNDYVRRSFTSPVNSANFFRIKTSVAN